MEGDLTDASFLQRLLEMLMKGRVREYVAGSRIGEDESSSFGEFPLLASGGLLIGPVVMPYNDAHDPHHG